MKQRIQLKNGISISYCQWEGRGKPIIALHKVTGYGLMWEFVASYLAADYRVIMFLFEID